MEEMKPCPFCESNNVISKALMGHDGRSYYFSCGCLACHALGPKERSEGRAIESWNMRANKSLNLTAESAASWLNDGRTFMESSIWININALSERLQKRGFSWQHQDYLTLQEALPELLAALRATSHQVDPADGIKPSQEREDEVTEELIDDY